jgi:hypothetical protein
MRSDVRGLVAFVGIILLVAIAPRPAAAATFTVTGYVKDFFVVQDPSDITVPDALFTSSTRSEVKPATATANNVRARVNIAVGVNEWLGLEGAYSLVPRLQDDEAAAYGAELASQVTPLYRIDDLRASLSPVRPDAGDHFVVLQNLDRLYATVSGPWFDLYLGRQAIAWGAARAVNPTDVIAPYLYTEIDTEHRIGVDAARLRVPVGALGEVDAGYVAGADAEWKHSAAFLRGKSYAAGIDYSVLAMMFRENVLVGADMTFPIKGAGAWIEAAVVGIDREGESPLSSNDTYTRVTTGLDYSLHNATYLFIEYHYNDAGERSPDDYAVVAGTPAYTEGGVYLLGRHYLIPGISWPVTPLWNLGGSTLINLNDGSFLLAPTLEFNATQNLYLSAGAFAGFGEQPRLSGLSTVVAGAALTFLEFESEFGAYGDVYFVSARYYF